jgi:tripartite-type tricarboxylate transporter receptor subunit TctC
MRGMSWSAPAPVEITQDEERSRSKLMRKAPFFLIALAVFAVTATVLARRKAASSSWPKKPVTLLVAGGAGTGVDLSARLFAERLERSWGQPVIVDNRPGGEGVLGFSIFAAGKDDHTLLFGISTPITIDALLRDDLPFDAKRDFVPVAAASLPTVVIAASTAIPASSLEQLALLLKTPSAEYFWSTQGGIRNLFAAFLKIEKLKMTYVPYQKAAEAMQDLGAGRLHVFIASLSSVEPMIRSGKVRVLAVSSTNRSAAIPAIPTVKEAGYPGLTWDGLFAVFGWRDMPEGLRAKVADDIRTVATDPALVAHLSSTGQTPPAGTPGELAELLNLQRAQFQKAVEILELKKTPSAPRP